MRHPNPLRAARARMIHCAIAALGFALCGAAAEASIGGLVETTTRITHTDDYYRFADQRDSILSGSFDRFDEWQHQDVPGSGRLRTFHQPTPIDVTIDGDWFAAGRVQVDRRKRTTLTFDADSQMRLEVFMKLGDDRQIVAFDWGVHIDHRDNGAHTLLFNTSDAMRPVVFGGRVYSLELRGIAENPADPDVTRTVFNYHDEFDLTGDRYYDPVVDGWVLARLTEQTQVPTPSSAGLAWIALALLHTRRGPRPADTRIS